MSTAASFLISISFGNGPHWIVRTTNLRRAGEMFSSATATKYRM
jgi:hypothetical protein